MRCRAGILTKEAVNAYLRDTCIPEHNARFAKPAAESGNAFVAYIGVPLDEGLCVQGDRVVGRDNCVSWSSRSLQMPEQHIAAIT